MSLKDQITEDMKTAMRAKDSERLGTIRLLQAAMKQKEVDERIVLDDAAIVAIVDKLIKQRKDSVEQFTKGNRPQLAEKEQLEIAMIEGYLPKSASEDDIRAVVQGAISHLTQDGSKLSSKDMGTVMRVVQQRLQASGVRADGKLVSEIVKAELAK